MTKEELLESSHAQFLKKIEINDEKLESVNGGKCSWWNLSCILGNNGNICTMSHECAAGCNV